MVVVCDDDLGKNLVRVDRIRDVGTTDVPERVARTMLATS